MKYLRFFLLVPVLFIYSCDEYYIEEVALNTETIYYTVLSKDWVLMDVPPTASDPDEDSQWTYFYSEFNEPLLTHYIFDFGMMNAYLTDGGNKSRITPLPFDNFFRAPNDFMWTEQVTCEFSPGKITFIAKYNDFDMRFNPPTYTFMVRLAW